MPSWIEALKEFNKSRDKYLIPKKDSPEYMQVKKIMEEQKVEVGKKKPSSAVVKDGLRFMVRTPEQETARKYQNEKLKIRGEMQKRFSKGESGEVLKKEADERLKVLAEKRKIEKDAEKAAKKMKKAEAT